MKVSPQLPLDPVQRDFGLEKEIFKEENKSVTLSFRTLSCKLIGLA